MVWIAGACQITDTWHLQGHILSPLCLTDRKPRSPRGQETCCRSHSLFTANSKQIETCFGRNPRRLSAPTLLRMSSWQYIIVSCVLRVKKRYSGSPHFRGTPEVFPQLQALLPQMSHTLTRPRPCGTFCELQAAQSVPIPTDQ